MFLGELVGSLSFERLHNTHTTSPSRKVFSRRGTSTSSAVDARSAGVALRVLESKEVRFHLEEEEIRELISLFKVTAQLRPPRPG